MEFWLCFLYVSNLIDKKVIVDLVYKLIWLHPTLSELTCRGFYRFLMAKPLVSTSWTKFIGCDLFLLQSLYFVREFCITGYILMIAFRRPVGLLDLDVLYVIALMSLYIICLLLYVMLVIFRQLFFSNFGICISVPDSV